MQDVERKPSATTLKVIHLAFMAATVVYVAVGYVAVPTVVPPAASHLITVALSVAAVAAIAAGYLVPRAYWRQVADGRVPGTEPGTLAAYQTGMIITWASFESVAVIGLVLAMITGTWLTALAGSVVALAFLASARPQPPR
ncbi:MAG: hypothetical protein R3D98_04095 [Candidatus Krumholzibacteriia bacterium]